MKRAIKILSVIIAMCILLCSCASSSTVSVNNKNWNTNYKYVFVHGLSGWGSYDFQNKFMKYWGMQNGDMIKALNKQGYDCYSASVNPHGSAWDRACELYAELTGTVVDYGKEHSERCKHERFGEDFSKKPLIDKWDSENKINLLGHSFGGATIRMLSDLMADGSVAEQKATDKDDLSPLFEGGKGDWIYSITALAAPHNGTTAYESNDGEEEDISKSQQFMSDMVSKFTSPDKDGRLDSDYADYDLHIDNAIEMNKTLETQENVYYFSFPCASTVKQDDGTYYPNEDITESMFVNSAIKMGEFTGKTEGGIVIDNTWLENDGLVNTISAKAPLNAPAKDYEEGNVKAGEWNIMPTYEGDHMSLQGGMMKKNNVTDFYIEHLNMINSL